MDSISRKFLVSVAAISSIVTVLASAVVFMSFSRELERRQIIALSEYVAERTSKEARTFSDLAALHRAAKAALDRRLANMSQRAADRVFYEDFPLQPDGTRRSVPRLFYGVDDKTGVETFGLAAFISDGRSVSPQDRKLIVAALRVVAQFGETISGAYDNFYFFTPHNRLVIFAPKRPDHLEFYRINAPANLDFSSKEMVLMSTPRLNPARQFACTKLQPFLQDQTGVRRGMACVTPYDKNGEQLGAFASSLELKGFLSEAVGSAIPGAKNLIISSTGDLIASPGFSNLGVTADRALARSEREHHLGALARLLNIQVPNTGVVTSPDGSQIIGYGRLRGPNWYFLVEYPRAALVWSAMTSTSWVLVAGFLAMAVQAVVIVALARRSVISPLKTLVRSTEVKEGRRAMPGAIQAVEARDDEIGVLARALREERAHSDAVTASLEQRVLERTAEIQLAVDEKSRFLANMSHELRTPLNGVIAVAELLRTSQTTQRDQNLVDLISTSGRLLESVLSDILDVSKLEAGQLRLEKAPFDLELMVDRIAQLHAAAAAAKGISLDCTVDPAVRGTYEGDAVRITQILSNLLSNAVKFTAAGSVGVRVSEDASGLAFSVTDTGIGFDEATRERLFRRFEQADSSITRRFGGTGLGLAICKSLAELMEGTISVVSTPGVGSTFTLTLPLRRGAARPAPAPEHPRQDLQLRTVLLAEDHPTNQMVVRLILEGLGVELTIVSNGQEAVEAFTASAFDLVIMDMQMPVTDGLTATRDIRAIEARSGAPRTPIIMLTANALAEHVEASLAAGADLHVAKPLRPASLLEAIARVTSARPNRASPGPETPPGLAAALAM